MTSRTVSPFLASATTVVSVDGTQLTFTELMGRPFLSNALNPNSTQEVFLSCASLARTVALIV